MRRFTILMALVVTMVIPMFAERVTPETARIVATTFLNNNGAKSNQLVDLSKTAGFQNLYIFSTENSFVVMAADNCVKPILGYSLTGCFDAEDMPDNVCGWLKSYSNEIGYAINSKMSASAETVQLWKALSEGKSGVAKADVVVSPIIKTRWNQNKYYNDSCPAANGGPNGHAYAGCVATAMAQIMNHWQYPSRGIGSHSYTWNNQTLNANFDATAYDWNNMADTYNYYYNDNGIKIVLEENARTPEQIAAVATLMFHCGVSVNMEYGGGSSGTQTYNVVDALKTYFNYSSTIEYRIKSDYSESNWKEMIKEELEARRPLEYCGSDISSGVGHAFVCDGYDDAEYFHFNWGWSGRYDGYFSLSNLNTGANNESGSGNGVYTTNQAAIFGIKPSSNDDVLTLTDRLSGLQDVILNWTNSNDAISYNIYRNGILISNTTANTYTETAPFGTNIYYVRSVNSADDLSLPSNLITITINYQQPIVDDLKASFSGNQASLTWNAPEWCYPETASATLTYGNGVYSSSLGTNGSSCVYWGHRYTTSTLANYSEMLIYKISFYASIAGTYRCFIYNGTSIEGDNIHPQTQVADTIITTAEIGWFDINLSKNLNIDESQDLWVFMFDPEYKSFPVSFCNFADHTEGSYFNNSNPLTDFLRIQNGVAWLIRTYLTDGTYTYNLYDNGSPIASSISDTTYSISNIADNTLHQYTIRTNYYNGETEDSNKAYLAKGTTSLETLDLGDDNMIVAPNSTLTVGSLTNTNPANLILENGAQLIHNSTGVKATVKKDVAAYTSKLDGWNLVASPVTENITPSEDNGLFSTLESDTIDLYYYSEPEHKWKNYQKQAFSIEYQKGYLYANNKTDGSTLSFAGTLTPSNETVTISNLSHSASTLNGINLVGNPFVCDATVNKDFYVMNDDRTKIVVPASNRQIAPCEGIFVQVSEADASVTFTKAGAKARSLSSSFDVTLTQGRTILDRARVRFEDKEGLEKFSLNENTGNQIYFPQDGKGYAVVCISEQNELPLNFEAAENGTYTLSIETENVNLRHLYLIDNLTGIETDLLKTPNYTFEAKTSDYASRFRLVYSTCEDAVGDNETFAFVNNGQIIITNVGDAEDAYNASLQIIDMTGRMVYQGDAKHCVSTTEMALGVYVLRLIDGENVRTQKIILK